MALTPLPPKQFTGKTIQMITLITLNPRTAVEKDKGYARGTL
jgi:hypothetical protein